MDLTRRSFSAATLSAPLLMGAGTPPLRARIEIDTQRQVGAIDPKIYGNFIEHLGRCIDGGVFQEGSALSDGRGFRKDVLGAAKALNVTQLRWPGGNFSSNYHWMDGIGPRDERPRRLEMAWGTVETNRFGTHEFMDYAEALGAEPYVCLNLGTGSWVEAQQWVEYMTSPEDTAMTRLRKKNGRRDPWKVTYWGLGNEMDGPWQMGHRSPDDYGAYALEAAKLVQLTNPGAKLIAAGASNFRPGGDWIGWNRTVLSYLKDYADYLSLHLYVGNPDNDYREFVASSLDLDQRIEICAGLIRAAMSTAAPGRSMAIALDEWNVWYRARGSKERGRNILEEHYNLEDALVVATFLSSMVNHADVVKMANMAQLVNVIAPIFTNNTGLFLQTIYYPLQLFANNTRGTALRLAVESPTYKSKRFGEVPNLDASASYDGRSVVINVVNRSLDQVVEADLDLQDRKFTGQVSATEVNGPDIKAMNDFNATPVGMASRPIQVEGGRIRHAFPPHSYTMIKAAVA